MVHGGSTNKKKRYPLKKGKSRRGLLLSPGGQSVCDTAETSNRSAEVLTKKRRQGHLEEWCRSLFSSQYIQNKHTHTLSHTHTYTLVLWLRQWWRGRLQ